MSRVRKAEGHFCRTPEHTDAANINVTIKEHNAAKKEMHMQMKTPTMNKMNKLLSIQKEEVMCQARVKDMEI